LEIKESDTQMTETCKCRCHKGNLGICLWCQGQPCSEFHPLFPNIKSNYKDTRVIDTLVTLRRDSNA